MTNSLKEILIRIALYALPIFLIQGFMLYVAWDSITSRIGDLSAKQSVYISQQQLLYSDISYIRAEVAFLKGKVSPVNFEKIGFIEERSRRFPKMGEGFQVSARSIPVNRKFLSPFEESAFLTACQIASGTVKYFAAQTLADEIDCFLPLPEQKKSEQIFHSEFEKLTGITLSDLGPTR